jgi:hypothetical protein
VALTQDQVITIRRAVGDTPDDAALEAIYARNGGSVGDLVLEVLERRLANLRAAPDSFSIPGEYSQSTKGQMDALEKQIAALGGGGALGVVSIVSPAYPNPR